jgi:hypothetical protein
VSFLFVFGEAHGRGRQPFVKRTPRVRPAAVAAGEAHRSWHAQARTQASTRTRVQGQRKKGRLPPPSLPTPVRRPPFPLPHLAQFLDRVDRLGRRVAAAAAAAALAKDALEHGGVVRGRTGGREEGGVRRSVCAGGASARGPAGRRKGGMREKGERASVRHRPPVTPHSTRGAGRAASCAADASLAGRSWGGEGRARGTARERDERERAWADSESFFASAQAVSLFPPRPRNRSHHHHTAHLLML